MNTPPPSRRSCPKVRNGSKALEPGIESIDLGPKEGRLSGLAMQARKTALQLQKYIDEVTPHWTAFIWVAIRA